MAAVSRVKRDRPPAAAALPLDDAVDQVAEVDALHRLLGARVGREIDELGDEIAQLGELDLGRVDQLDALRRRRACRPRCSSSMFVRSAVSGVRSSWLASITSRRCCARDEPSAASIVLKLAARRPSSSCARDLDVVLELLGLGDLLGRDR